MNEAKKRDFVSQMITLLQQEQSNMTEKGFAPAPKISDLSALKTTADTSEIAQQEAAAKAKNKN